MATAVINDFMKANLYISIVNYYSILSVLYVILNEIINLFRK